MPNDYITIEDARQHNLKGISLKIPLNKLTVITGVSGSGKSSLAFDTLYAEGQRRYVETFSSYARQFLDRMDRPRVGRIEGVPPAIAIDQTNPVRTSRSTVGTMTELNDHIKLLFARAAKLYCSGCARPVTRNSADGIFDTLLASEFGNGGLLAKITFSVSIPANFSIDEVDGYLAALGYTRVLSRTDSAVEVVQDQVEVSVKNRGRTVEDLEVALKYGHGTATVYWLNVDGAVRAQERFSSELFCPNCNIRYKDPVPNMFSFNSPIGACETCRGFGRTIGINFELVIPDHGKSLAQGAIKPWQTASYQECQDDMTRFAKRRGVPLNVAWKNLSEEYRTWVIDGDGQWEDGKWYGIRGFFAWLESRSYRMHIRVLLSRYRSYAQCPTCKGARLRPEALLWKLGEQAPLSMHDVMLLPIGQCLDFFKELSLPRPLDKAAEGLLGEIVTRLRFCADVGLNYLTLDRQSRTLSGGEVQRINLTTALGTSLVNALFVLDEPSIGLHSRDIGRLISVLHRLRDAGNTLVVVEHDPEVIRAADCVIDMGPGPGEKGGDIVFMGPFSRLLSSRDSLTARYLNGRLRVAPSVETIAVNNTTRSLEIKGAAENNLKRIDVKIPLNRLVCITGVSGSGKSTLVQNICYYGLRRLKSRPVESPGKFDAIIGHELVDDVVLVDQSPVGKTTRSNPISYIGAFNAIRDLFSAQPIAQERGYTSGSFSFNSGNGRCPTCGGNGFEHVEMQFLSDVFIRCPDCDGRRFRPELLEVTIETSAQNAGAVPVSSKSIADVLDMTVDEACLFFSDRPVIIRNLAPLKAVGLSYMRLGQPLPTLSGGEAQRLKLAGHLTEKEDKGPNGTLFFFDEPTTGLHFDDIHTLLDALRSLVGRGHSVVVIEHNLDVIGSADWLIDMGPEGGEAGGEIVFTGTPADCIAGANTLTGSALKAYALSLEKYGRQMALPAFVEEKPEAAAIGKGFPDIFIRHAREHNLRNISVHIPRDKFTVLTGVSGSGKSTIAFDILFAEGQRRYLESLNAFARQFIQPASRPDIDGISGVPPTVAIEQRTSRGGRKSTVATVTEIYHFLRLLFVKLGIRRCPDCDIPIEPQTRESIVAKIMKMHRGKSVGVLAPLVVKRKGTYGDLASWAMNKGFSELIVDGKPCPVDPWPRLDRFKEHSIDARIGVCTVAPGSENKLRDMLARALDLGKSIAYIEAPGQARSIFSTVNSCPRCHRSFEELDPRLFSFNSKHGWCEECFGTGLEMTGFDQEQTGEEIWWNDWWEGEERLCQACGGARLRPEALAVKLLGSSITEYSLLSIEKAEDKFKAMTWKGDRERLISRDIIAELLSRLDFLKKVGLGYLTLDRSAPSLSGGEAQRIRIAAQMGSSLRGVCYVLDEPTIGLHARDNDMLLKTLRDLKDKGNTIVVVEHDEATIRQADHIIDLGPGGGKNGGELIAEGALTKIMHNPRSVTGTLLKSPALHTDYRRRPQNRDCVIKIKKASLHNLKNIDIVFPLGLFICVTGVSGSGKSTLVRDILFQNAQRMIANRKKPKGKTSGTRIKFHGCESIEGLEAIGRILEVDQRPIGKTPRSCPATYIGIWDDVRKLFSRTPEAAVRAYSPSRFSFNVAAGRCPACEGQGIKKIEMSFLPDVTVSCDVCGGARFSPETLTVLFKGKSIADILRMSVSDAVDFFAAHASIQRPLKLMEDIGLGYLTLGQHSPTLSGGEAQRIKLVAELATPAPRPARVKNSEAPACNQKCLYILDEPTIGLHMADVSKLIAIIQQLVSSGNTVVVIEHNLDMIAQADWIIDLGPEGGEGGGRIVAQGVPDKIIIKSPNSHTARYLKKVL